MGNYDSNRKRVSTAFVPASVSVKAAPVDVTGKRFGLLVAQRVVGKHRRSLLWRCACDCGASCDRALPQLRKGRNPSCGCGTFGALSAARKGRPAPNKGKTYTLKGKDEVFRSRAAWRDAAVREFGKACQRCGWDEAACDVHHKVPRSLGGKNTLTNAIVLCPNCHRVAHEAQDLGSVRRDIVRIVG